MKSALWFVFIFGVMFGVVIGTIVTRIWVTGSL